MRSKVVGLHVDSRRDTITTHRFGISSAASFEIFLCKPVDFTGPKCFHFQTLKNIFNAVVSSVACFGSGHRAIYNSQLATLDVQFRKLCRSIVGPPPEVDWNALGMRFFMYGMNVSAILLQMHTLIHGLTSHAETTGIWPGMLPLTCKSCGATLAIVASYW